MKRLMLLSLAILLGMSLVAPEIAQAAKKREPKRETRQRTMVVVRPGHPIRRGMHRVVYRRPAVTVRVTPSIFLPLVVWRPLVVARPAPDLMVWQDSETLDRADDWSETYFDSNQRGSMLYLEVTSGRVQFDFAEVVFENGDTRVVDFSNGTRGPGVYQLLDFRDGRRVDHVRLIARARTDRAKVALIMQK
jgi:hypothetical protein